MISRDQILGTDRRQHRQLPIRVATHPPILRHPEPDREHPTRAFSAPCQRSESLIRWRYWARLSRISSAVLRQTKGRGSSFQWATHWSMSRRRSATLWWVERRSFLLVSSANQRSTWLIHEL